MLDSGGIRGYWILMTDRTVVVDGKSRDSRRTDFHCSLASSYAEISLAEYEVNTFALKSYFALVFYAANQAQRKRYNITDCIVSRSTAQDRNIKA